MEGSFIAVSRAPIAEIEAARQRMGWTFLWVSCAGNRFNHDFGATFSEAQAAAGEAAYNYGTSSYMPGDMPACSVFARDPSGGIFHTYSAYARGTEALFTPFNFLDMAPKGRNETGGTMSWVRLHDEYDDAPAAACCGAAQG